MRFPPAQRFLCRIGAKCALRHFQGGGVLRALAIFNCQGYGSDDPIAVVLALRAMGTLVLLLRQQRTIAAAIATAKDHCPFSAPAAMGALLRDLASSQQSGTGSVSGGDHRERSHDGVVNVV
jgi:hypothetical protein